jgi:flagellar biosynthesis/type III secretory pathway protein FliH
VSFAVLHHSANGVLAFAGARIEHKAFKELVTSDELLYQAQAAAQVVLESAERKTAEQFERAREEGFAQGRAEGIVAVLGTLEIERRMRELLTVQIASLVEQCVRNILADIGPEEVFRLRVHRLIRGGASAGASKLHVSPGQAHLVHAMLAQHTKEAGADMTWLVVESDEACARDMLVLETQVGFIDASLDLTLASVGDIIGRAVERAAALLQA